LLERGTTRMRRKEFVIPQQFMVGDIKINTKAQLKREYTRLLIDAFVPYQEEMLAFLDDLIVKHDPQLVENQLNEVQKQREKKSTEWEQTFVLANQTEKSEREKLRGKL